MFEVRPDTKDLSAKYVENDPNCGRRAHYALAAPRLSVIAARIDFWRRMS